MGGRGFRAPPARQRGDVQAWRDFLQAAVARYGPGGSYWTNGYRQRFGADAKPLPIQSWQIWNEPNLSKYFDPGQTVDHAAQKYARLLQVSHDAIKSRDPQAQIVLAGMPGYGDATAWKFLDNLYQVSGVKDDFDVAALIPMRTTWISSAAGGAIPRRDDGPRRRGNAPVAHRARLGIRSPRPVRLQRGPTGQKELLSSAFKLILQQPKRLERPTHLLVPLARSRSGFRVREVVQHLRHGGAGPLRPNPEARLRRVPGLHRRDDPAGGAHRLGPGLRELHQRCDPELHVHLERARFDLCLPLRCALLRPCDSRSPARRSRTAPIPSTSRRSTPPATRAPFGRGPSPWTHTPPAVAISSGPAHGSTESDPNPAFGFATNDPDATLECELDGGGFEDCTSPLSASGLPDGSHTFRVKATDRAQNTSVASRTWTVDTTPPTVTISSGPAAGSTSPNRSPAFGFATDEPDVSFGCRFLGSGVFRDCGSPFTASGLADGSYTFQVKATDAAGNTHVASRAWTVDGPADVSITGGLAFGAVSKDPTPSFVFSSLDADSSFSCQIDDAPFASCTSPFTTSTLPDGLHTLRVQATDAAETTDIAWRRFKVDVTAPW